MDFSTWQQHTLVDFVEEVYLKMKLLQEEVERLNEKLKQCSCDEELSIKEYVFTMYPPREFPETTLSNSPTQL